MYRPRFSPTRVHTARGTDLEHGVLYSERLHVKALLKRLFPLVATALVPPLLIATYVTALIIAPTLHIPSQYATYFQPSLIAIVVLIVGTLLCWATCWFLGYRAYYEWQHTVIELTRTELAVYRPRNVMLFLSRSERDSVRAASVIGFRTKPATLSELLFFRTCITASVTVTDMEDEIASPVDDMHDVRHFDALERAVGEVSQGYLTWRTP